MYLVLIGSHDGLHRGREHEGRPLSLDAHLPLEVTCNQYTLEEFHWYVYLLVFIKTTELQPTEQIKPITYDINTKLPRLTQNVSKVDVEEVSALGDHQVVVVSVAQPQHIRRHAVGSCGDHEVLHASV